MFVPHQKPSPMQCPQHFCFFWREAGTRAAPGMHKALSAAIERARDVDAAHCGCSYGRCIRLDSLHGDKDWYEPCEPALAQAGLPWFYFIPAPHLLVDEARAEYIADSEQLWGAQHWQK